MSLSKNVVWVSHFNNNYLMSDWKYACDVKASVWTAACVLLVKLPRLIQFQLLAIRQDSHLIILLNILFIIFCLQKTR